jgi:hypothetical protein
VHLSSKPMAYDAIRELLGEPARPSVQQVHRLRRGIEASDDGRLARSIALRTCPVAVEGIPYRGSPWRLPRRQISKMWWRAPLAQLKWPTPARVLRASMVVLVAGSQTIMTCPIWLGPR